MSNTPIVTTPGVYPDMPAEVYHAGPGISKSGLWKLWSRSPYHYRFGEPEDEQQFAFGTAGHCAVLEPEHFEARHVRGPADRRGNKWRGALEEAGAAGKLLLTDGDYDGALRLRDALHRDPDVRRLTAGEMLIEHSAYWIDEETGELCRCRPDAVAATRRAVLDLKTTGDAHPDNWWRRVTDKGFHVQDVMYREGWAAASGQQFDEFVFLVIEEKYPHAHGIYWLPPAMRAEGQSIHRQALAKYARCRKTNRWPSYGAQELTFPRYAYSQIDPKEFAA